MRRRRRRDHLAALELARPPAIGDEPHDLRAFSRPRASELQRAVDDELRARAELRPIGNVHRLDDDERRP